MKHIVLFTKDELRNLSETIHEIFDSGELEEDFEPDHPFITAIQKIDNVVAKFDKKKSPKKVDKPEESNEATSVIRTYFPPASCRDHSPGSCQHCDYS